MNAFASSSPPLSGDPLDGISYDAGQTRRQTWWTTKGFQDGYRIKVRNLAKDWASGDWNEGGDALMALRGLLAKFPDAAALAAAEPLLASPTRPRPLPQDLWSTSFYRQRFFETLMAPRIPLGVRSTWMQELAQAWQWVMQAPLPANQAWKHPFLQARRGKLPADVAQPLLSDGTLDRMDPGFVAGPVFDEALFRNDKELLDALDARGVKPASWQQNGMLHFLARRHLHGAITRYAAILDPKERDGWGLNAAHAAASKLSNWRVDRNVQGGFARKTPEQLAQACHRLAATLTALSALGVDIDAPAPKPPKATEGVRRERRGAKGCKEGETLWQALRRREMASTDEPGALPPGTLAQVESLRLLNDLPPGNDDFPENFEDDEPEALPPLRPRARL